MGTNFYAKKKLKPLEKKEIHQKLDEFLEGNILDYEFIDFLETKIKEIHLGKKSGGWQFLWQTQPEYYQENLKSIQEFLTSGDYEIRDEYGKSYSFEEFINSELERCLYSGYTHETYQKDHPEKRPIPPQYMDWITSDGLRFVNGDFS